MVRERATLNGTWRFYPAFDRFTGDLSWMDSECGSTPEISESRALGWKAPDFDDSGWLQVGVPSSWNTAIEGLWSYEGVGWYRRQVHIPAEWECRRVEFHCEGANYRTEAYVNGQLAGIHEGGHTPFSVPIQELALFGERNTIAVECDNTPRPERVPGGQSAWWNHGGLYRDVSLQTTPRTYIDDFTVTTRIEATSARVRVETTVASEDRETSAGSICAVLLDGQGRLVANRDRVVREHGPTTIELEVHKPQLWTPENPNLYTLMLRLVKRSSTVDELSHRIGIRTVNVRGNMLLLNGMPILIKGLNRHEQYPCGPLSSATHDEGLLKRDLDLVQELGANALRCHYPNHRRLYELCDERGILNLVEVPLWQWGSRLVETDSPDALTVAKGMLEEIIKTYKNHASVIMWSVSNENFVVPHSSEANSPEAIELSRLTAEGNKELVALAKKLDPTRPVIEASNHWPEDPVFEVTDLLAVNAYVGSPTPPVSRQLHQTYAIIHEKLQALRSKHPQKPILVTEFGKWTVRGLITDYPPGEAFQAEKLRVEWEGMLKEPNFVGGFIWCFADYDVHRRYRHTHELRVAYGLYDLKRRPKSAVATVRGLWAGKGKQPSTPRPRTSSSITRDMNC